MYTYLHICTFLIFFLQNLLFVTLTINKTSNHLNEPRSHRGFFSVVGSTEENKALSQQRKQKTKVLYSASQEAGPAQANEKSQPGGNPTLFSSFQSHHFVVIMFIPTKPGVFLFL